MNTSPMSQLDESDFTKPRSTIANDQPVQPSIDNKFYDDDDKDYG